MADINVERKSGGGRSILPWILGLLLLGALIWGLSRLLGGGDDEINNATTSDTTVTTTETMPTTGDPAATGTMAPAAGAAAGTAMPMDSAAAGTQMTGAVDSAGGDTVAEGAVGNP